MARRGITTPRLFRKMSTFLSHIFAISLLLVWFLFDSAGVHSQFITQFQTSGFPLPNPFGGNGINYIDFGTTGINNRQSVGFSSNGNGESSNYNQQTPQSPCPQTFQYQHNGQEFYGSGAIQPGQYVIGQDILLMAQLIVGSPLPSSYYGKIKLTGSPELIVNQMYNNEPIQFEVQFPIQNPLPVVSSILVNGNSICSSQSQPNFSYFTKVTLQYMFQPVVSPNFRPRPSSNFGRPNNNQNNNNNFGDNSGGFQFQNPQQQRPQSSSGGGNNRPTSNNNFYPQAQNEGSADRFGSGLSDNNDQRPSQRPPPPQPTTTMAPIRTTVQVNTPPPPKNFEVGCGRVPKEYTPLVFGGQSISKGEWPFVAALHHYVGSSLKFKCGATIVSKTTIISAAHCFYDNRRRLNAEDVLAFMGHWNLKRLQEEGSRIVNLASVIVHPDYNTNQEQRFYSDIAIGKLSETVEYSEFIQPACLWTGDSDQSKIVGQNGVLVGWGRDETGVPTAEPKKIEIPVVSEQNCLRSNVAFTKITSDRTFCAGWRNGSEGPCNGDSGAGLMLNNDGMWNLRGLVSTSIASVSGGCNLDEFVVFTDVAKFTSWITALL